MSKWILGFLLANSLAYADLPKRPMSMVVLNDPSFGIVLAATARQGIGEGLTFEWADSLSSPSVWHTLANISVADQEQNWTVYVPKGWSSGRTFVRARGLSPADSIEAPPSPFPFLIQATEIFSPAVDIERK